MTDEQFPFPDGFLWGVATAAHQVEGNNYNNNWWAWEQEPGHIKRGHRADAACNWWANAERDFDLAAEMGLNTLRLSVEWSRIEPQPDEFDPAAIERYSEMLDALHERDLKPMVTLHHFTDPLWLTEQGGWENPDAVERFRRFTHHVVKALGDRCTLWCTINEPNVYSYIGYVHGTFPPGKSSLRSGARVARHLLQGHAAAYHEIHDLQPEAQVGLAHNLRGFDPANPRSPLDRWVSRLADRVYNQSVLIPLTQGRWVLPIGTGSAAELADTLDWIGLNYYTRDLIAFDRSQPRSLFTRQLHADDAELLDGGYGEFYPEGMFRFLKQLGETGLPIYVTENGIPDDDDDQRPRYLLAHLMQVWRALQDGVPVRGYLHWTLVDNFEWAEGWTLRFGLVALDRFTQARTPRPSAELYGQIAQANALSEEMLEQHAPELGQKLPDA